MRSRSRWNSVRYGIERNRPARGPWSRRRRRLAATSRRCSSASRTSRVCDRQCAHSAQPSRSRQCGRRSRQQRQRTRHPHERAQHRPDQPRACATPSTREPHAERRDPSDRSRRRRTRCGRTAERAPSSAKFAANASRDAARRAQPWLPERRAAVATALDDRRARRLPEPRPLHALPSPEAFGARPQRRPGPVDVSLPVVRPGRLAASSAACAAASRASGTRYGEQDT